MRHTVNLAPVVVLPPLETYTYKAMGMKVVCHHCKYTNKVAF